MVVLVEQDVRRLDVAVDEAVAVGGVERAGDLGDDVGRAFGSELVLGAHERAQIGPVDVAHDDEQHALALARVVDGDDVRVLDGGRRLGFGDEALSEVLVVGERGRDDFQRDRPLQAELRRAIDDAHPTAAGEPFDAVIDEDVTRCELRHV